LELPLAVEVFAYTILEILYTGHQWMECDNEVHSRRGGHSSGDSEVARSSDNVSGRTLGSTGTDEVQVGAPKFVCAAAHWTPSNMLLADNPFEFGHKRLPIGHEIR
jgi:hypothetical protein